MLKTLKVNHLIILVLIAIIFLQRECSGNKANSSDGNKPTVKIDTQYIPFDRIVKKDVPIYITIPGKIPSGLISSKNCDTIKTQYNVLVNDYVKSNIYKDTLDLKEYGYIEITDTVQYNKLGKRNYNQKLKMPVITKTITEPSLKKFKMYIGANIGVYDKLGIYPGLIFQTKKDHIYTINTGIDIYGNPNISAGTYWKISFKKDN